MRLLGDRLLLAPLPDRVQSEGGIILPQGQVGDVRYFWKVEAIGEKPNPDLVVGDTVVTPLYFDHVTLEDGTGRKIVKADQIIAKLEAPTEAPANPV